ncbi:MAG: phage head closure protein [Rickettsiales bacterium]|nr:phage head closure protein [Pseudomonadota bacterium]MDA0966659.1 phage head closure protein [Pseudomonadota bacterium]MDG4543687.1 phage head closure protein [Rickettsiales bacterium]MDG4545834.1 phage head closure protein [Rickettsiales bacterium]MDG4547392.1 phage head closure protein [Rickettsiales bacterium]
MTKNNGDIASQMRHVITFQSQVLTADNAGGNTIGWTDFMSVWAKIEDISKSGGRNLGAEKTFSGQLKNTRSYRITIRYISGVTTDMRVLFDSRVFNIRSVINVNERNEMLQIFAEEGVTV